jgi:hypothetical protein
MTCHLSEQKRQGYKLLQLRKAAELLSPYCHRRNTEVHSTFKLIFSLERKGKSDNGQEAQ